MIDPQDIDALMRSGTFDPDWYVTEYPDVRMLRMDPAEHYLWIGQKLMRRPSAAALSPHATPKLHWGVVTTAHTLFLAQMIAANLRRHGWSTDVMTEMPLSFNHDYYIVLTAQIFDRLPPPEKRILYQLEQSINPRWFSQDYLFNLENSLGVLDYAMDNIAFLGDRGIAYPLVHYLPIGAWPEYNDKPNVRKDIDVLFYGDHQSCLRRQEILKSIDKKFNIKIIDSVFGDEIKDVIRRARVVLNIHYYENALLETPRIQECLSLGTSVLSETTSDRGNYPHLGEGVTFFDSSSATDLIDKLDHILANPVPDIEIEKSTLRSSAYFQFMFDRFLIAGNFLPSRAADGISIPDMRDAKSVCLSLPETISRRRTFETVQPPGCEIFDGIRRRPGWIGCGLSYKVLAQNAMKQGLRQLTVMEDDVILPDDFESRLTIIQGYLDSLDNSWDVFSGVIASLHPECEILDVRHYNGIEFVTVDRMTSTVFNIYNQRCLDIISNWQPIESDVDNNTIDRYLEGANLRVVTTTPFMAGHREELSSTLWGFQNSQYRDMIAGSERKLKGLKDDWLSRQRKLVAAL